MLWITRLPASNISSRSDGPAAVTVARSGSRAYDHLDARRLAVVPFRPVARTIGTNDAVPGGDFVPKLRFARAGTSDAAHVDGKPIGVQRVELVGEAANSERGRTIGREDSRGLQSGVARFPDRVCQSNDEFRMQTLGRKIRALPRHGVTRIRGLDHVGARFRNLGRCPRRGSTGRLAVGGRVRLMHHVMAAACRGDFRGRGIRHERVGKCNVRRYRQQDKRNKRRCQPSGAIRHCGEKSHDIPVF